MAVIRVCSVNFWRSQGIRRNMLSSKIMVILLVIVGQIKRVKRCVHATKPSLLGSLIVNDILHLSNIIASYC